MSFSFAHKARNRCRCTCRVSHAQTAVARAVAAHQSAPEGNSKPRLHVVALNAGYDTRPWLPCLGLDAAEVSWFALDTAESNEAVQADCVAAGGRPCWAHFYMVARSAPAWCCCDRNVMESMVHLVLHWRAWVLVETGTRRPASFMLALQCLSFSVPFGIPSLDVLRVEACKLAPVWLQVLSCSGGKTASSACRPHA